MFASGPMGEWHATLDVSKDGVVSIAERHSKINKRIDLEITNELLNMQIKPGMKNGEAVDCQIDVRIWLLQYNF